MLYFHFRRTYADADSSLRAGEMSRSRALLIGWASRIADGLPHRDPYRLASPDALAELTLFLNYSPDDDAMNLPSQPGKDIRLTRVYLQQNPHATRAFSSDQADAQ